MSSPLIGNFQSWERQQPTEWGPLRKEDGGSANRDDAAKTRFTTGVYSNTWENRAQSINIEVLVEKPTAPFTPPLPVNLENPTAWLAIQAQGRSLGSIKFELKADLCPLAAENFYQLCDSGVYKGSYLHRIIPGCMVQGGDYYIRAEDGSIPEDQLFDLSLVEYRRGGRSIYEEVTFGDENYDLKHVGQGVLSMASEARGVNGSQFFVTLPEEPLDYLDKRYQVFGQVLEGMEILKAIEPLGTIPGKVLQKVIVEDCGVGSPAGAATAAFVAQGMSAAPAGPRRTVATGRASGRTPAVASQLRSTSSLQFQGGRLALGRALLGRSGRGGLRATCGLSVSALSRPSLAWMR